MPRWTRSPRSSATCRARPTARKPAASWQFRITIRLHGFTFCVSALAVRNSKRYQSRAFYYDVMLEQMRTIADYQFGRGAGRALFPDGTAFVLSRTGRVRQITGDDKRIATVRANDGFLILSTFGGERLKAALPFPLK